MSSRSPAAVDMYDIVSGNRPRLHGEMEVSVPAKYIIIKDKGVILVEDIVDAARLDADDWAEKIRSSKLKPDKKSNAWRDVTDDEK